MVGPVGADDMRDVASFLVACFIFSFIFLLGFAVASAAEQHQGRWESVMCLTNSCIGTTLNGLPVASADSAKLTTWGHATYVWFRR